MELTPEQVERGYNNRAAVPDHARWFAHYAEQSRAARERLAPRIDLRYGPGPKETLDLFVPSWSSQSSLMFFHGGYWRAFDKADFSFVATPFVAQGIAVAVINYDLCPEVSVATIVQQSRRALSWLVRNGGDHGASATRIVLSGHSAGGHLVAMMLAADWAAHPAAGDAIVAAVSVSGVHDLAPMVLSAYNVDLKLDAEEAARLSPVKHQPRSRAPLLIATGAGETAEFRRQAQIMWDAWPANRPAGVTGPMFVAERDHFSVIADYGEPTSELTRATLALFAHG